MRKPGFISAKRKYGSEEVEQLLDELLSIMDLKTKQPTISTMGEGSKTREHVPNWAFIVIIVSIVLSAVAFYIGTCINKKHLGGHSVMENQKQQENEDCGVPDSLVVYGVLHPKLLPKKAIIDYESRTYFLFPTTMSLP
ncbi:hypothetical protein DINM_021926 [Dirofilaria immitis]|nr:hypothetical protein [Dirofilaria immitis]